ncbi:transmembrane protein 131-like [Amphibalanus amphitrite]|uniref:transmembrane protein 131-like n=1 Tax=Amphibalanus amphitrite TaxID=1232801 RepID=UPI001C91F114|nr:transmembrane protein 131-like [Amphibalanus amphitrite]
MDRRCIVEIFIFCSVLDLVCLLVGHANGHSQAFIQIDNELRYLVDGVSVNMYESISEDGTPSRGSSDLDKQPSIRFDPPMLDFKEHPLGMPHVERVMIYNPSAEHTISMLSISGSTVHFHCTFFQEKMVPPLGNTSLDVVFLGREVGPVESYLYIHSSVGSFRFKVKAEGTPNPYRLKPLVGVKMPLNSSYSPLIEMYNPHKTPLQVTEMYSSGGDLHLELPSGDVEGSRAQWQVPPYHSRPVMRASFVARQANNHTAFIRIKTNSSGPTDDYLVLPVEVEVSAQPGLFCPLQRLDFGLVAAGSPPRQLWLPLLNAANKPIHLQHVVASPANDAVQIEFEPLKIPPTTGRATNVARVTFYPDRVRSEKQLSGKIFIKSKSNQHKLQIPYSAEIVPGSLEWDETQLQFHVTAEGADRPRNVTVTNRFAVPLAVYNVSLTDDAGQHFKVSWRGPRILTPNESASLLSLTLRAPEPLLQLTAHLVLYTNVTELRLPVTCYTGKLRSYIVTPEGGSSAGSGQLLDFGTLGVGESRDMYFYLLNENPIPVELRGWGSNFSRSVVELAGTDRGAEAEIVRRHGGPYRDKHLVLKPHHYAIMRVGIVSPEREGLFVASAFVHTEFEQPTVPFRLRVALGSLSTVPAVVTFEKAFPGKTSAVPLSVYSAFGHAMTVSSVRAEPADRRLVYRPLSARAPVVLEPEKRTALGELVFEPARACEDDCYTGFQLDSKRGTRWLQGLSLPANIGDVDSELFHSQYDKYRAMAGGSGSGSGSGSGGEWHNISVTLDTSEVRGYQFWARAQLGWPQLIGRRRLRFGVTQVGNVTVRDLTIENPSELPLAVHVSLLSDYPATQATMDIIQQLLGEAPSGAVRPSRGPAAASFTLLEAGRPEWSSSLQTHASLPHDNTVTALVSPGGRVRVPLVFGPREDVAASDVVIIRNNLTALDMLVVQGRGAYGQLQFGSQRPGSSSPLLFELVEKHLKDCSRKPSKHMLPNFTVKRAFTTRNVGEVAISISNFTVNGLPCEGFGFRVLNCAPFQLQPNSSRKVEVAFTPDFTTTVVRRKLELHTSLQPAGQPLVYSLHATVPPQMLELCSRAVPRPDWEPLLYYVAVTFMIFMLFSILTAAFFESDRILKDTFDLHAPPAGAVARAYQQQPRVFDLRRVADGTAQEEPSPAATAAGRKSPRATAESASPPATAAKPVTPPAPRGRREQPEPPKRAKPERPTAAEKDESETVRRRRKAKKEAKSNRSWASTFLETLGMNSGSEPSAVIEDVSAAAHNSAPAPRKSTDSGQQTDRRDVDDDESCTSSSTTDHSHTEDVSEKEKNSKADRDKSNNKLHKSGSGNIKSSEKSESTAETKSDTSAKSKQSVNKKVKAKTTTSLPNLGSLELPYKPKTVDDRKDKRKQRAKATIAPSVGGTVSPSSSVSSESAPPVWDAPSGAAPDDAFGLLSQQTESFARSGAGLPARSSFASIVSGQSGDRPRARAPPVGKIAPEVQRPAAGLGPIGPRHRQASPPLGGLSTVWATDGDLCSPAVATSPLLPTTPVKPMPPAEEPSSFGLHSLAQSASTMLKLSSVWSTPPQAAHVPPPQPAHPTFMQGLQADRRMQTQQYDQPQRQATGAMDEWPGFGSSCPFGGTGSLWEPTPAPPAASLWGGADLGVTGSAWPADPARPFCPPVSSPWAPGAAAADSGWPQGFPSDDGDHAK